MPVNYLVIGLQSLMIVGGQLSKSKSSSNIFRILAQDVREPILPMSILVVSVSLEFGYFEAALETAISLALAKHVFPPKKWQELL